jgi:hypothetical protein
MKILKDSNDFINLLLIAIICFFGSGWVTVYFGGIGKYSSMLFSILLLCFLARKRLSYLNISKFFPVILFIVFYYIAFQGLAFFQQHQFKITTFLFGLSGLIFMMVGAVLGASSHTYFRKNIPTNAKKLRASTIILSLLIIFGIFSTLRYANTLQSLFVMGAGRSSGDQNTNPVGIAYMFSIVNICAIHRFFISRNLYLKILSGGLFVASLFIIISTTSRGAILYCTISYVLIVASIFPRIKSHFNLSWLLSIIAFICILLILPIISSGNEFIVQRINSLIYRFTALWDFFNYSSSYDQSSDSRLITYQLWFDRFSEWVIFGFKYYGGSHYPHNSFLEIAVRFGILGWPLIISLILAFYKSIKRLFQNSWVKNVEWYLFSLIFIFSFLQSMTSLSLEINRSLWFAFGYMIAYKNYY